MFNELTSHPPQKHAWTLSAEAPCILRMHQHVYLQISKLGFLKKELQSLCKREGSQTIILCHPDLCCQKLFPNAHHQKQFVTVYLVEGWPSVRQWTPAMSESAQIWGNMKNWQSLHCPQHVLGSGGGWSWELRTFYLSSRSAALCLGAQHTRAASGVLRMDSLLGTAGRMRGEKSKAGWRGRGVICSGWWWTDCIHESWSRQPHPHRLLVPRCGAASQVSGCHQPFCY